MTSQRAALIGDTAIAILAERGMRGLTHRAVDEAAGLPTGSTSNHARTRAALLELTLARLADLEEANFQRTTPGPDFVDSMADALHHAITIDRAHTIARYELALEATRRPELRKLYDALGHRFRTTAITLLTAAGSPDPVRHGHQLVAYAEGLLFDATAGAGQTPTRDDLHKAFTEILAGILPG
ncbi:TetR/AcrR family transcriptional regulator [Acrocarpospora catenulata]|uniref:TetR/AcrR family transcriptional regulator n=1 Tax=Acrocarpospora catenulata TaxID=2836182 RepID=UPI001BDAFA10|nr:TetR/AcrR family transcriptional regulator [Acrocarpospora catenulata]